MTFQSIATREIWIAETGAPVTVSVGAPRPDKRGDWVCPYRITGLASPVSDAAIGVDGVQALILAFEGIRRTLEAYPAEFSWVGEEGDHGFPRTVLTVFGREFAARIGGVMDEEIAREVDALKQRALAKDAAAGTPRGVQ